MATAKTRLPAIMAANDGVRHRPNLPPIVILLSVEWDYRCEQQICITGSASAAGPLHQRHSLSGLFPGRFQLACRPVA